MSSRAMLVKTLKDQLTLDRKGFQLRSSQTCSKVSLGFSWNSDILNRGGSKLRGRERAPLSANSNIHTRTYFHPKTLGRATPELDP
ncbi:hypothetical protein TSUD_358020 [Trifolium subterraneum]|uniref:Uncharacterized protein n=1 Tax=Trifolium subterraneum TaxID=3900 RepID=A0A2Z6MJ59_TRISU|nr:hypothetical protein TSUD_358020 [Trifolium subterraneum]